MNLIDLAIQKNRTFFSLLVLIFIAGVYSYINIPKESRPDIPIPTIYVSINYDGISPEDSVNLLIKPMEKELRSIEGLDELQTASYEGGGNITLTFQAGFDNEQALNDVRNQVDLAKSELPDEADEPVVTEINLAKLPILSIILSGDVTHRELKRLSEDLRDRLEGLEGVLEVTIDGLRETEVLLEMDKSTIESYNLRAADIQQSISSANLLIAAGSLEVGSGKYAIKVPGLFKNLQDFFFLPVLSEGNRTVTFRDLSDVKLAFKDSTSITRSNGHDTIILSVTKRIGKNVIETVDRVKAVVEESQQNWPESVSFNYSGDESKQIRTMLYDLQNSVIFSIILVMIVVLAALGLRSAALVSIAIPGSFLLAMIALFTLGFTTNVVVLFALILSVGMLVDGAIVVTELADSRMREGATRRHAFSEAAKYMAMPIISSTLTTLAAFMPLLFWPDIVGEFMKFMPLTLIFTLTASLIMALIFLPLIGANIGQKPKTFPKDIFQGLSEKYSRILKRALEIPGRIMVFTVAGFIGVIIFYGAVGKGVQFFPETEAERAFILIRSDGDFSIQEKDNLMKKVERRVGDVQDIETMYFLTIGAQSRRLGEEDIIGKIFVQPVEWHDRNRGAEEIYDEIIARIGILAGADIELQGEKGGPQDGKPIQLAVISDTPEVIAPIALKLKKRLQETEGVYNITDTIADSGIEWILNIDRDAISKAGITLVDVGTFVRLGTTGAIIGTYRPNNLNEEVDITARFKKEDRKFSTLDNLYIPTPSGPAPVTNFIEREAQRKVSTISRLDQKFVSYVEADVNTREGYLTSAVVGGIKQELSTTDLPKGVRIVFKGDDEQQSESSAFLKKAFLVALFVMAIILVTQFNSYYQAFIILSAVVLSTTGVLLGHIITGKPFGIVMGGLGVIALAGIVVNNNIVLIDTYNKLRQEFHWKVALIETGRRRLRPVLLTAITTIIGLIPMGTKVNVDLIAREITYNAPSSRWWDQLANSIMFGLFFATALTLIITPCMIALSERRKERQAKDV
jgi:multidrug efflux pump